MPLARRQGWRAWASEVFADVYATMALGPAFTIALLDFLAVAPARVAVEWQGGPWAPHPPSALRALLNLAVLRERGFGACADELQRQWIGAYPTHAMGAFEEDVHAVARAVIDGPYAQLRDAGLTALQDFDDEAHERAIADAVDVLGEFDPRGLDARELVASARLAYDRDPGGYRGVRANARLLARIDQVQTVGTRAGPADPNDVRLREARHARDRAAGAALRGFLLQARATDGNQRDV